MDILIVVILIAICVGVWRLVKAKQPPKAVSLEKSMKKIEGYLVFLVLFILICAFFAIKSCISSLK
jgi:MFS superfamily sulfate permease-like transporter